MSRADPCDRRLRERAPRAGNRPRRVVSSVCGHSTPPPRSSHQVISRGSARSPLACSGHTSSLLIFFAQVLELKYPGPANRNFDRRILYPPPAQPEIAKRNPAPRFLPCGRMDARNQMPFPPFFRQLARHSASPDILTTYLPRPHTDRARSGRIFRFDHLSGK